MADEPQFAEDLPNGIHVHKLPPSNNTDTDYPYNTDYPWIASITIGPWYYCQGGSTRDTAIKALFAYMKHQKQHFVEQLKRDQERLATLDKFLETESCPS